MSIWTAYAFWFSGVVCGVVGMIVALWLNGFIR